MTKNIITKLDIDELSAVDRPANQHARTTLVKRAPDADQLAFDQRMREAHRAIAANKHQLDEAARLAVEKGNDHMTDKNKPGTTGIEKAATFGDAVAHFEKSGMSPTAAMRAAKGARPDLYEKLQATDVDADAIVSKAQQNRQRANQVQALAADLAAKRGLSLTKALSRLRAEQPALFEDAA